MSAELPDWFAEFENEAEAYLTGEAEEAAVLAAIPKDSASLASADFNIRRRIDNYDGDDDEYVKRGEHLLDGIEDDRQDALAEERAA